MAIIETSVMKYSLAIPMKLTIAQFLSIYAFNLRKNIIR